MKKHHILYTARYLFLSMSIVFAICTLVFLWNGFSSSGVVSFINLFYAIGFLIVTVVFFVIYLFVSGLYGKKTQINSKNNAFLMDELVSFAKSRNELLTKITKAHSYEELESLRADVDLYNARAELFTVKYGVSPKLISYSDFDAKLEENNTKMFEEKMHDKFPLIPVNVGDWEVKFRYHNQLCMIKGTENEIINYAANCIGCQLNFVPEPENVHDRDAVAIYLGGKKLGYIYKTDSAYRMVPTWIRTGRHFCGYLSNCDADNNKLYYDIGFYKKEE